MAREFIHYIRRQVRQRLSAEVRSPEPFYSELQSDLKELAAPKYHTTRALSGPAARVKAGDRIWLVAQLFSVWGALPPALDARIEVAGEPELIPAKDEREKPRLRFASATGSRWFPLADANATLQRLCTQNAAGASSALGCASGAPVGLTLQRMRELTTTARHLHEWESCLDAKGFDFVSYRLVDGTRLAFEQARKLILSGRPVFWDRWSLPRRLAERRERLDPPALNCYLRHQIAAAKTVWIIRTPRYGEAGSYSVKECETAADLGKNVEVITYPIATGFDL